MSIHSGKIYASVWKAENKGNYTEVQFSTSRKDYNSKNPDQKSKKDGRDFSYANSSWGFVRFVGQAHGMGLENKVGGKSPVRIVIPEDKWMMTRESYKKEGETVYPKNPQLVVFGFEYQGEAKSEVKPPVDEDEFPF